jgi:hypothetical protein
MGVRTMSTWLRWEDDDDGTIILINLEIADTINLYLDNDGERVAMVSLAQQRVSTTRDPETIDRLIGLLSAQVALEEPWTTW